MRLLLMWMPGPIEIIVIGLVGLLVFGRRLPEVGRSLGRSIIEFKKGIRDVEDDIDVSARSSRTSQGALPSEKPTTLPDSTPEQSESNKSEV